MLRGMRKKFMMVLRASSGMYWERIFMMDGQKMPTQASNTQNPKSWRNPPKEMLPPFAEDGATRYWFEARGQPLPVRALDPIKLTRPHQWRLGGGYSRW